MKKGIILTLSTLMAAVLLTAGLFGCSPSNSAGTNPPTGSPQTAPVQSSPSEVKVSLNNQVEGAYGSAARAR